MTKLYHIDRCGHIKVGEEINLKAIKDIKAGKYTELLQNTMDELFPCGVSRHGEGYILNDSAEDRHIEMILEMVRRDMYCEKISRFESFFAVEYSEIKEIIKMFGYEHKKVKVYEVECDIYSKHDMNLICNGSNLLKMAFFKLYWEGKTLGEPLYEYLLKPPVRVIREINDINNMVKEDA